MTETNQPTATSLLRWEHERILDVASTLAKMLGAENDGVPLDFDLVSKCITFFRLFADECHHAKEEEMLFPTLGAQGFPQQGGPVAVMLHEHEEGRVLVNTMAAAISGAREGVTAAGHDLRTSAIGFINLITAHIAKENGILFNIADEMITGAVRDTLLADYGGVTQDLYEGLSREELVDLGEQIVSTFNQGV